MATLVIDRQTHVSDILSFLGMSKARIDVCDGRGTIASVIDPDDYDNDTDYINAVPGYAEKILAARNAPASERERVPRELFNV